MNQKWLEENNLSGAEREQNVSVTGKEQKAELRMATAGIKQKTQNIDILIVYRGVLIKFRCLIKFMTCL